ncbi:hypothetical protein ACJMK2_033648 [Sinanodonta woodiana]|uniref:PDZ and LIM domain protein Zasp n=1 Tax=Sinanodonta woodiana TaxID=1069815 RepID=A0ABD3WT77_SINWO
MSQLLTLEAKLERADSGTAWGFRMQGGKDFSAPFTINRVTPGSLAAKCGLQQGDIIKRIGNVDCDQLKHKDAQDAIVHYGNKLDLLLQRIREKKRAINGTIGATFPNTSQYDNFSSTPASYQAPPPIPPPVPPSPASSTTPNQPLYNKSAKPFGSTPNKAPTPFGSSGVSGITQQTQNLNIGSSLAQKYADAEQEEKPSQIQSRSFKFLQDTLESGQVPPAPPAPHRSEAPPSAPKLITPATKPGVWTPSGQPGQASGAKPFTPSIRPPPPLSSGPISPPSKPTGVGAVRGKIGDAVMRSGDVPAGGRIPVCASCGSPIRGPFVMAMGKSWCPDHFVCQNPRCGIRLIEIGFVEEGGNLYCEKDYELYFAPHCAKCDKAIVGECVNALQKTFHPACFVCHHCKQPIAGGQFHLEDGNPYCENDWRQMFQTMCNACNFPIEPGDRWVEALSNNYHSECFNCSTCQVNLEGQPFYAKAGKPYCKKHAR